MSAEPLKSLFEVVEGGARPVLIGSRGESIELPNALNELFVAVVDAMKRKEAVFLMHENEAFTTQAAPNFAGVSRHFLVRLLEKDELPYHHAGTHRRVFFKDLVTYQRKRSEKRLAGLEKMTADVVAAGLDDRSIDLTRPDGERLVRKLARLVCPGE